MSFKGKEAEKIFQRIFSSKLPHDIQKTALRKLFLLHAATNINDMRIPPSNRLEILARFGGKRWSIRINDQWRICFLWENNNAFDVEIIDYH